MFRCGAAASFHFSFFFVPSDPAAGARHLLLNGGFPSSFFLNPEPAERNPLQPGRVESARTRTRAAEGRNGGEKTEKTREKEQKGRKSERKREKDFFL